MSEREEPREREDSRQVVEEFDGIRDRRLKAIFDAREQVREVRLDIEDRRFSGGKSNQESAMGIYRSTLETYLQELEPLFLANPDGREIWDDRDFGTVVVSPPVSGGLIVTDEYHCGAPDEYAEPENVRENVNPVEYNLTGLSSLLSYPNPLTYTFEFRHNPPGEREKRRTATGEGYVDKRTLDSMFRAANRYLAEVGIGIDMQQSEGPQNVEDTEF